ncbi:hypothetical protein [Pseudomonas kilonensis]|uniref:Phage abortive infection protein n=1 Tax=Pseudomonas kilonensis TaxID=132476 RepID=A0ABY0Z9B2_9PSED|nr:hypothetical protein [Pseudomonas kilonensis]SEE44752.1 hypothetical protein SAMN04490188_3889 [Pseudomonas kilonensis]
MKVNWILAGVGIAVGVGVVVAVGVLWAYGYYLGPVSRLATDWGSFGSVMSGAFTLLSSFATIGTLLFLYLQQVKNEERQVALDAENLVKQQRHDDVVEKQLAALTFEQYLNHRKVFIERLNGQAIFFKSVIRFADPDRVYTAMFPNNSPSRCDYNVEIVEPENAKAYDLTDCLAIYRSVGELLENYKDKEEHLRLVQKLVHLQGCLGIEYIGPHREGDVFFLGRNAGLNIYNIEDTLIRVESVLNSILFYSGNQNVTPIHHKAQGGLMRDALYRTLTSYHRAQGAFEIRYEIEALPCLHDLYDDSQHFIVSERMLEETYRRLETIFADYKEVEKLKNYEYADNLTDIILHEIQGKLVKYKDDPGLTELLVRADRHLWAAMELLCVTR